MDIENGETINLLKVDSTNIEAHRLLKQKKILSPLWIVAEEQTGGKGRGGKKWISNKGNLFATLILPISFDIKKLPMISVENAKLKIPNMGWFSLNLNKKFTSKNFNKFLNSLNEKDLYYFVHSYFVNPSQKENIVATYNFGGHEIPAIVSKDHVIGCQFHPEKSGKKGLDLIDNFLKLTF